MSDIKVSAISKALQRIIDHPDLADIDKCREVFKVFTMVLEQATEVENISFTTLFSRLAYVGAREDIAGRVLYRAHFFRRYCEQRLVTDDNVAGLLALGQYSVLTLLNLLAGSSFEVQQYQDAFATLVTRSDRKVIKYMSMLSVIILRVDVEAKKFTFIDEATGDEELQGQYDVGHRNEIFTANFLSLHRYFDFPLHANLIDVHLTEDGLYQPAAIVVHPDYLVDVTAVAECFSSDGADPMFYLLRKFMPRTVSAPLMIGNIVNHLLDELINDPGITFEALRQKIFRVAPLQFALYDDKQVLEILGKCYSHFLHMKKVVNQDFKQQKIYIGNVYLEPSFYSRKYGIQGRLDLLHLDSKRNKLDIVELKSGKPWRPNTYGLSHNHYTQTLLYDLIMQSTYDTRYTIAPYILYSVLDEDQLKYAPVVKAQQYEALKVRNDIIAIENQLATIDQQGRHILHFIDPTHFPDAKGFVGRDIDHFSKTYQRLDDIERAYFDRYVAFVSREHQMGKTGEHGLHKSNGLSALWLENRDEKEDRFAILAHLEIADNDSKADPPIIRLIRTADTHPLANFRAGDIAVMYPASVDRQAVLRNQIFKCSILEVTAEHIEIRLRSRQYNQGIFRKHKRWHIEEDMLDSSFTGMYRSMYQWASAPPEARQLLLGRMAPRPPAPDQEPILSGQLTEEQARILKRVISAKDYYLLWGPPGTGKTSMMLKHYVNYLLHQTSETILIMAYTNRAVDEICTAIEGIGSEVRDQYLRLGSRYGCGLAYRDRLLRSRVDELDRRSEVLELLRSQRIYVSTVSSISASTELLSLINFDTVIIDEASQILEPMLVGLLPVFAKWVMIGDHKQLPAVVRQRKDQSQIDHPELQDIGVVDCGMSLFERLYLAAIRHQWDHAIGILGAQGRMHKDLMAFPNHHFYAGKLQTIAHLKRLHEDRTYETTSQLQDILQQQRTIYIPCRIDESHNWKVNLHEAAVVSRVIKYISSWYDDTDRSIDPDAIGVITPYRAQIAQIKAQLTRDQCSLPVSVDTVERYQGGARDIIIISLCTNKRSQLDALINRSSEGIDRKLNVALTRAREQVIIIGNEEILRSDETYAALLDSYYRWQVDG